MYEKTKKNFSRAESFENLSEKYRNELMNYYRERRRDEPVAVPAITAPKKSTVIPPAEADMRPLFPLSSDEAVILPRVEEQTPPPMPAETHSVAVPEPNVPPNASTAPFEPDSPDTAITEMMRGNENSIGFLQIRAATGTQAIPIANAHVTVYREEGGKKLLHQVMVTNRSGETPTVQLPAPPESLSESPGNKNPFSTYTILVHADGFQPVQNIHVPIFANIRTIQPVNLIPLEEFPENPNAPQVFIGQEPNL